MIESDTDSLLTELRYGWYYIRSWLTRDGVVANVLTCVIGAFYISRRVWPLISKIMKLYEK